MNEIDGKSSFFWMGSFFMDMDHINFFEFIFVKILVTIGDESMKLIEMTDQMTDQMINQWRIALSEEMKHLKEKGGTWHV